MPRRQIPSDFTSSPTAATCLGAVGLSSLLHAEAVAGLRRQARLGTLARALAGQAWAAVLLGNARLALTASSEASALGEETGYTSYASVANVTRAAALAPRGGSGRGQRRARRCRIGAGARRSSGTVPHVATGSGIGAVGLQSSGRGVRAAGEGVFLIGRPLPSIPKVRRPRAFGRSCGPRRPAGPAASDRGRADTGRGDYELSALVVSLAYAEAV